MNPLASNAVLGAGSWGTVLAWLLAENGHPTGLWGRDPERMQVMSKTRENEVYIPGLVLPDSMRFSHRLEEILPGTTIWVIAVPSYAVPGLAKTLKAGVEEGRFPRPEAVVSATKGLEPGTFRPMTSILAEAFPGVTMASISGPNLARELAAGMPTAAVLACEDPEWARRLQENFNGGPFRTYTSTDLLGVQLAGALKNVLALATGMAKELGYGANSQAALLTRGLAEMTRLGVSQGAEASTFQGLAGMGDVLATCTSELSRNFRAGRMAARGLDPEGIRKAMGQAVEGINTCRIVCDLAQNKGIELPLCTAVHHVLFDGANPEDVVRRLMNRPPKAE